MPSIRVISGGIALALLVVLVFSAPASAGPKTAAIQVALKRFGLYNATVDGVRGPLTRAAITSFQRRNGLSVDGVVGPQTRAAFGKRGRPALGSRTMKRGDRGWDVASLQYMLARRGYPPGAIDAVFGPMTDVAVRNFQGAYGLTADGLAGPITLHALRHGSASRGTTPVADGPVRILRPLPGPMGDRFGAPRSGGRSHTGIDFPAPSGTTIRAAGVGVVEFAGWNSGGYGNLVVVRHRLGYTTWYAHMSSVATRAGAAVSGGTRIGYVGSTGNSTGPHLHFELRRNAVPVDPMPYLLQAVATRRDSSGGGAVAGACPIREPLIKYGRAVLDACRAKNLTRGR